MTTARADLEPSAWPLAGYWLASLFAVLPAVLASSIVYSLALAASTGTDLALDSSLALAFISLPMITAAAYYRSARRYGYAASPVTATVVALLIWLGATIGAVLTSFGDPALADVAPELLTTAHRLTQSALWGAVALLTVNVACAPALNVTGMIGRAARVAFLGSTALFGVLIAAPAVCGLAVAG